MKYSIYICFIFFGCVQASAQADFLITKFGARPGLTNNNDKAIQRAIDAAAVKGGRVVVPAGNFMTGPLELKSNVELHLEKDAVLLGSINRLDYGPGSPLALIVCKQQKNVSITGHGVIDGRGRELVLHMLELLNDGRLTDDEEWRVKRPTERNRPSILYFFRCHDVRVSNVSLKDAASWVQNYKECEHVVIDSMMVQSTAYWNNDGIDLVDSRNVTVTNSFFNTADDAICLKSEIKDGVCENILIENCTARSSASGFKIGTGSLGGFRNITVRNLTVYDTYRSAVALETVDGAFMENIHVSKVIARNTGNAIFIRLGHRNKDDRFSVARDIVIEDLKAEIPLRKPDMGYPVEGPLPKVPPHNLLPASVVGIPGHMVKNVVLRNIEITYEGGASREKAQVLLDSLGTVPENPTGYPEFTMFGELPAWGLYVRHAEGMTFQNIAFKLQKDDFRPALVFDDVKGVTLKQVSVSGKTNLPAIVYRNTSGVQAASLNVPAGDSVILNLKQ